jgi:uncharacterized SAM-binding protein YcdF (DUF218 family)
VRVVAVLGYSGRRGGGLHPVCAQRLAHAEGLAEGADAIVFSGWARSRADGGEAELMRAAWQGPDVLLVCDSTARNTAQNAAAVARITRRLGATEVLLVTSRWHARRAALLLRAALRGSGIEVDASSPADSPGARLRLRELVCLAGAPFQALRLKSG